MTRSAALLFAALLFALPACGGGDDEEAGTPPGETTATETAPTWSGPTRSDDTGAVDVDAFNSYVAATGGELARSPRMQAEAFPGAAFDDAEKTIDFTLDGDTASATVTVTGLEDDSIHSQRWELDFARTGETWSLASARFSQRCHQGRGHQEYTPELCL